MLSQPAQAILKLLFAAEEYRKNVMLPARRFGYPTDLYERTSKRGLIGTYMLLAACLLERQWISETQHARFLRRPTPAEVA